MLCVIHHLINCHPWPTAPDRSGFVNALIDWIHSRPRAGARLFPLLGFAVVRVVFDIESTPPVPVGTFIREDGDAVFYTTPAGTYSSAPADCVTVVDVDPIRQPAKADDTCLACVEGGGRHAIDCGRAESATSLISDEDAIDALRRRSTSVPGRDGVRQDEDGRIWYSARWIGVRS